jgi:hypothetical protein
MEVVNTSTTTDPVNMYNYLNSYILNPMVFIIIFLFVASYYVFSSSLGNGQGNSGSNTDSGSNIMGIIIFAILFEFL